MDPPPLRELHLVDAGAADHVRSGDIWAEGSFEKRKAGLCDRCFRPGERTVRKAFRDDPDPERAGARKACVGPSCARTTSMSGIMRHGDRDETTSLWEQVALELPRKVLCTEECRGLCPACGKTGTGEACSCAAGNGSGPSIF